MARGELVLAIVDAAGRTLPAIAEAAALLPEGVRVVARCRDALCGPAEIAAFADVVRAADALILLPCGGTESIPGRDALLAAAAGKLVHVQATARAADELALAETASTGFGSAAFRLRHAYLRRGGPDNARNLILTLCRELGTDLGTPEPPCDLPTEGIYHPDCVGTLDTDAYLAWERERLGLGGDAPVVGIWFCQSDWANGDLAAYDALIAEIECRGAIPLAVFHMRVADRDLGNLTVPMLVERYFKRQGRAAIDVLLSPMRFSLARTGTDAAAMLADLDVPVLQMIMTGNPRAVWEESLQALSPVDVSMSVAQPEFDGVIVGTVAATREIGGTDPATGAHLVRWMPVPDRVRRLVGWALNWAALRRTPPEKRKIAILFHHCPRKNHRLGAAAGLDSFASVKAILDRLKADGHVVARDYADGDDLAAELLDRLTNDRPSLHPRETPRRAAGFLETPVAAQWFSERSAKLPIGGVVNGNIFLGIQPSRDGLKDGRSPLLATHATTSRDPVPPAGHHHLAYYRWLREDFGAQAVIHVGTPGSLEWLPGKSVGLSESCHSDAAIADLPNLCPYIIHDPGEGTQAKRRAYAAILDHMVPAQTHAGKTEAMDAIEELLEKAYFAGQEDPATLPPLIAEIWGLVADVRLDADLGLDRATAEAAPHAFIQTLHAYLNTIDASPIADGLHVFGQPPDGPRFNETLIHLTRLPNDDAPSLWDAIARSKGLAGADAAPLGQILDDAKAALDDLDVRGWTAETIAAVAAERFRRSGLVREVLTFVAEVVRPKLVQTTDELEYLARGVAGRFIPPGGSGAPTRGCVDILPTGRNFYSVDPGKIPTREAWKVGVMQGDALVARYRAEHGRFPERLGMVLWASPTMRTRGDDVALILYLMGVRPVWDPSDGRVKNVEVIPLAERAFPRLDLTVRASGVLRDTFPALMSLIDAAARMVAALKEPEDVNVLARNVAADREELLKAGVAPEDAARRAGFRVFSDRPGFYGTGVQDVLESGQWENVEDLGEVFVQSGGYAFGAGVHGEPAHGEFRRGLGRVDFTVQSLDTRESDIFSSGDYNGYQGGMNAAVNAISGCRAPSYNVDSSDPRKPLVRATAEEGRFVFRTRVLNPKWIAGMKRHGFKGAGDMAALVECCAQWDATSGILDDWQYAEMAGAYALDPEIRAFFREHNPYALQEIAACLLEAISRNLWENPGDAVDRLGALLLDAESRIADRIAPCPKGAAAE